MGSGPDAGTVQGISALSTPGGWIREWGVAFTLEGRYLATANPDGTVYVLRLAKRGEMFQVPAAVP